MYRSAISTAGPLLLPSVRTAGLLFLYLPSIAGLLLPGLSSSAGLLLPGLSSSAGLLLLSLPSIAGSLLSWLSSSVGLSLWLQLLLVMLWCYTLSVSSGLPWLALGICVSTIAISLYNYLTHISYFIVQVPSYAVWVLTVCLESSNAVTWLYHATCHILSATVRVKVIVAMILIIALLPIVARLLARKVYVDAQSLLQLTTLISISQLVLYYMCHIYLLRSILKT